MVSAGKTKGIYSYGKHLVINEINFVQSLLYISRKKCLENTIYLEKMRKSKIWTSLDDDKFRDLVKNNIGYSGILKFLGLSTGGTSNFRSLKERIEKLNIDISHFKSAIGQLRLKCPSTKLEDILVENSTYSRNNLKKKLIKLKLIDYKCSDCENLGEWNNKKLSLILDHINGIYNDNRLENLRFLCPNCNAQTDTFAGKNKKYRSLT